MKKMNVTCVLIVCLAMPSFASLMLGNPLDDCLALPEQAVAHLQKDFKNAEQLKEYFEKGLIGIRGAEPQKMLEFKQRFGVSDKALQAMLMDIIRELSVKAGWEPHPPQRRTHDTEIANWCLRGAIIWLGACADTEGKEFLMSIVADSAKEVYFRETAIESCLYRTDAQEMQGTLTRFLIGDMKVVPYDTYLFAVQQLYDSSEGDLQKREAIVAAVSATLAKEENRNIIDTVDTLLAKRSKMYADSPQRKAALERLNIPIEKGGQ